MQSDLPSELAGLAELIAEHLHESVTFGADLQGPRPLVVPSAMSSGHVEPFYEYAATETLKTILALGYQIVPSATVGPLERATRVHEPHADLAHAALLERLGDRAADVVPLLQLWRQRGEANAAWQQDPELSCRLAALALRGGQPLAAYDVISDALRWWPEDVRLRQLQGLALARLGATAHANQVLADLHDAGQTDEETLGMLARTYKDLWEQTGDPVARRQHLQRAAASYTLAYEQSGGYWTGINAATLTFVLGDEQTARALASRLREQCLERLSRLPPDGDEVYWLLATVGETALVQRDWAAAEHWYGRAGEAGQGRYGDLATTRRNARLLLNYVGRDAAWVDACLQLSRVIVFDPRLGAPAAPVNSYVPPPWEGSVRAALRERLEELGGQVGYAAAGAADLLFLEELLAHGGEAHIVMPYDRQAFRSDWFEILAGQDESARFDRVLAQSHVVTASPHALIDRRVSFDYGNRVLHGLARLHAEQLGTRVVILTMRDAEGGDSAGRSSTLEQWRGRGYDVELIDVPHLWTHPSNASAPSTAPLPNTLAIVDPSFPEQTMAMLFADALHFSGLREHQLPTFVQDFLGLVAEVVGRAPNPPVLRNTWGDGVLLVFTDVADAGRVALELSEQLAAADWEAHGLPPQLTLRISLHAGPVLACTDPITGRPNFIGTHVNQAARIEPITPPGQVYASEAFAALAAAAGVSDFTCEYVGQTPLAKGFGTFPTYHVRRSRVPATL